MQGYNKNMVYWQIMVLKFILVIFIFLINIINYILNFIQHLKTDFIIQIMVMYLTMIFLVSNNYNINKNQKYIFEGDLKDKYGLKYKKIEK